MAAVAPATPATAVDDGLDSVRTVYDVPGFVEYYNRKFASDGPKLAKSVQAAYRAVTGAAADATWTCVDAGCGPGHLASRLRGAGHDVWAYDLSKEMVRMAKRKFEGAEDRVGEANLLDPAAFFASSGAPEGGFDLYTITFNALNHLPGAAADVATAIKAAAAALRPGGVLLFDLETKAGLDRLTRTETVEEEDGWYSAQGMYVGNGTYLLREYGFLRIDDEGPTKGLYRNYDSKGYLHHVAQDGVLQALKEAGMTLKLRAAEHEELAEEGATLPEIDDDALDYFLVAQKES